MIKPKRLIALEEAYAGIGVELTLWAEWAKTIGLDTFRGESQYLGQLNFGATRGQYAVELAYVRQERPAWLDRLEEDGVFGVVTFDFDGKTVSRDLLDSILEVGFLHDALDLNATALDILDIGAGYGRFAHRLLELFDKHAVYCVDAVPISTLVCERYLGYRGYQRGHANTVPLNELDETLPKGVDVACNIHSWSECSRAAIDRWLGWLVDHDVRNLFIVPHDEQFLCMEPDKTRPSYLPSLEAHGYKLATSRPKYPAGVEGAFPTTYYLFERGS